MIKKSSIIGTPETWTVLLCRLSFTNWRTNAWKQSETQFDILNGILSHAEFLFRTVEASGPQDSRGWAVQKIVQTGFPSGQWGGTRQTHLEGQGLPRTGFVVRSDYFRDLHNVRLITILRELKLSRGIYSPRKSDLCRILFYFVTFILSVSTRLMCFPFCLHLRL